MLVWEEIWYEIESFSVCISTNMHYSVSWWPDCMVGDSRGVRILEQFDTSQLMYTMLEKCPRDYTGTPMCNVAPRLLYHQEWCCDSLVLLCFELTYSDQKAPYSRQLGQQDRVENDPPSSEPVTAFTNFAYPWKALMAARPLCTLYVFWCLCISQPVGTTLCRFVTLCRQSQLDFPEFHVPQMCDTTPTGEKH